MKLYIDFKNNNTGKAKFIWRLIPALERIGIKCSLSPDGCDIALGVAWQNNPKKGMPYILRTDGLSFNKGKDAVRKTGDKIRASIKLSNAVIWQTMFCKKILEPHFPESKEKKQFIIFNGADPKDYEGIDKIESPASRRIIMSAHWYKKGHERPNKRLLEMLEIAGEYCARSNNAIAWIAGETNLTAPNNKVIMLGHLPEDRLRKYIVSSTAMLYLAHYDWCPNSVIESLVAGTPVICANASGVAEIVGDNGGIILPLDSELRFKDLYEKPPPVSKPMVLEALENIELKRISKPELHIDVIAEQYKKTFMEVLKNDTRTS